MPQAIHNQTSRHEAIRELLLSESASTQKFLVEQLNKKGFSIPLKNWIIRNYRNTFCERLLDEKFCFSFGIEIKKMEEIINDHINQKNDYKWPLFTLYSLSVWCDAHN